MRTRGEYSYDAETQTIRSNDFKRSTMMGDYRGVIVASFSEATGSRPHSFQERDANVSLFMAALDAAHALDEAGYDGEKAIRELPELVEAMGATMTDITDPAYKYGDVLTFANRIREINALMQVALDKIRGEHDRS